MECPSKITMYIKQIIDIFKSKAFGIFVMKKIIFSCCLISFVLNIQAQMCGCTDVLATNYNPNATINDGSCLYNSATINYANSWLLPQTLNETSGLLIWNQKFWTHNDDTDNHIYGFDTLDIDNYTAYPLELCVNNDWEEISQDEDYLYIGDFGNNVNGNRTDLKILRVDKISLLQNNLIIDTISFSYSLQSDFSPTCSNNSNFDCEAFVVSTDSIYLFTKEWVSKKSTIYSLPKIPGNYIANFVAQYNVQGLITGATYLEDKRLVALSGYSQLLQPFIFLLYDFQNHDFFGGNKRKITLNIPLHQTEGIASNDGLIYFISNERFTQSEFTSEAKIHRFDLSNYLNNYINPTTADINSTGKNAEYCLYPNPTNDLLHIKIPDCNSFQMTVYNSLGQKIDIYQSYSSELIINVSNYKKGVYFYIIHPKEGKNIKGKFIVDE